MNPSFQRFSSGILTCVLATLLVACAAEKQATEEKSYDPRYYYIPGALNAGEDAPGDAPAVAASSPRPMGDLPTLGRGAAPGQFNYWTIVLKTFTREGHRDAAANMAETVARISPKFTAARPHTTPKGSMVVYGAFEDSQSPDAQAELEWVKSLSVGGRMVFPRAMLTRIDVRRTTGQFRQFELMSVRRQYARVNPLYSLQVAVWGDFGSGEIELEEVQARAEAYARQLRMQGHDAYFHHDPDKRLSMVTVGLFNHTAIDNQSGIYSPEVERLIAKFPEHLVNGEPLLEPIDPKRPQLGTRTQIPKLVLVPEL